MVGPESPYIVVLVVQESTGRGVDDLLQVALYSQSACIKSKNSSRRGKRLE